VASGFSGYLTLLRRGRFQSYGRHPDVVGGSSAATPAPRLLAPIIYLPCHLRVAARAHLACRGFLDLPARISAALDWWSGGGRLARIASWRALRIAPSTNFRANGLLPMVNESSAPTEQTPDRQNRLTCALHSTPAIA